MNDPRQPEAGDDASAPTPVAAPPALARSGRLGGTAAAAITLAGLLAMAASAPWTEFGTQVLLSLVPGLSVKAPAGTLVGDFQADRLSYALGNGQRLVLDRPHWSAWRLERDEAGHWQVHIAQAGAARAALQGESSDQRPPVLPGGLQLPVGLRIEQLRLAQLDLGLPVPVRDLQARLHLGAGAGARHHLSELRLAWERLQAVGSMQIGADAPLPVVAHLHLQPLAPAAPATPPAPTGSPPPATATPALPSDWQADLRADGPARELAVQARVEAAGQHLDAQATLEAEAAWPLTRLVAEARALDLAALGAGLPTTALSGTLRLLPLAAPGAASMPAIPAPAAAASGVAPAVAASAVPATPPSARRPAPTAVRLQADLVNARPGRWADGALPLSSLQLSAQSEIERPDRGRLERLALVLADAQAEAGEIHGDGQWQLEGQGLARVLRWTLQTEVKDLQPARLDPAAPGLRLRGPVVGSGDWPLPVQAEPAAPPAASTAATAASRSRGERAARRAASAPGGSAATPPGRPTGASATPAEMQWRLRADLGNRFPDPRWPDARLQVQAQGTRHEIRLERFEAGAGSARARLSAHLQHQAPAARGAGSDPAGPWRLQMEGELQELDPTVWWPGLSQAPTSPWRRGPHRLNGRWQADLQAQVPAPAPGQDGSLAPRREATWRSLHGEAQGELAPSRLAGVPLAGRLKFLRAREPGDARAQAAQPLVVSAELGAGSRSGEAAAPGLNRLGLEGQVDLVGTSDRWTLRWSAPQLAGLNDLLALAAGPAAARLEGDSEGQVQLSGRWPALASQGQASARQLSLRPAGSGEATAASPPWRLRGLDLRWQGATTGTQELSAALTLDEARQGDEADSPRLEGLVMDLRGRPAAHRLTLQADLRPGARKPRSAPDRGRLRLLADGGLTGPTPDGRLDWTGQLQALTLREVAADPAGEGHEWLRVDPTRLQWRQGPDSLALEIGATRVHVDQAALALDTLTWRQRDGLAPQLALRARLEPLPIAPLLQRAQPEFGWRGDLRLAGMLDLSGSPGDLRVDAELRREAGDLVVDEPELTGGPQRLGLSEVRLAASARGGRWRLTQHIAGSSLGTLDGEQLVQADAGAWVPAASAPVTGRLDLRVDQLGRIGNWGRWLPAGWRVGGQAQAQARVSGRLDAPRFSGELKGQQITVRNALEGVDWQDAELLVALDGETARIETFSVRAGTGSLTITGQAQLGASPRADLQLRAERFAVLQRVDRRLVASGQATLGLSARSTVLKGRLRADEGRIDFTRSDAPSLADDVTVVRASDPVETPAEAGAPREPRRQELDLRVDLGPAFTVKGRGLNTRLEGELQLTSPANRLAVNGTIRAVDGTYAAYGQKLGIDRGEILFRGPAENPRLDIQATRSDLDEVRVGVAITGTAQNPRVRLYSDPEMVDNDKLSWLLLGRAADGLARTDLALLQRAAYALVAGESDSPSLMQRLGVDSLSVRQETDGDVRATVVSLGKQISRRWYLGYERSLNATTGTWQLIYRIAQRFTLRAQSGAENAIDLIWTWKWGEPAAAPVPAAPSAPQPAAAGASR